MGNARENAAYLSEMDNMNRSIAALIALLLVFPVSASAFIVTSDGSEVTVRGANMAILHGGDEQTLIMSVDIEVETDSEVVWILPLPAPPSRVERAGDMLWGEITSSMQVSRLAPPKSRGETAEDDEVEGRVIEGADVSIVSFPNQGEDARSKLIEDVGEEAKKLPLSFYSDQNWTFVRMKWTAKAGRQRTAPLVFDFKTPFAVAPVRSLASDKGTDISIYQFLGSAPVEDHYLDAFSKGGQVAKDRRKSSGWAILSEEWMMGRTVFFARDLKLLVRNHYTARFSEEGRGYFQAVIFDGLDKKKVRNWKEDLLFADRGTSMKVESVEQAAIEEADIEDTPEAAEGEAPVEEEPAAEAPAEGAEEVNDAESGGEEAPMDWTLILGVSVLIVVGGLVGMIQLMRMR